MTREELEQIIEDYRELLVDNFTRDQEKSNQYGRYINWVEDNINMFEEVDDDDELWSCFLEAEAEGNNWDSMFPDGDEDDSISDYMTRD